MAYRVSVDGDVIEVDTPAEAAALIKARAPIWSQWPRRPEPGARVPYASPVVVQPEPRRPLVLTLHEETVGTGWTRFRLVTRYGHVRIVGPLCAQCLHRMTNGGCPTNRRCHGDA